MTPACVCVLGDPPVTAMHAIVISFVLVTPPAPIPPEALALFRQWCKSPSPELRIQAVRILRGHAGRDSRVALLSLLSDKHPAVRAAVRVELVERSAEEGPALAAEIAALRTPRARIDGLRVLLARRQDPWPLATDRDPEVRARVLAAGCTPKEKARPFLRDPAALVRAVALEALGDPVVARAHVADRAEQVRIAAARVIDDAASLQRLLRDRSWRVRLAALRAARRLEFVSVVPALIERIEREKGRMRARAVAVLEGLTRVPFGDDIARWRAWWQKKRPSYELPPGRERPMRRGHSEARITFRKVPVVSQRVCFVLDASRSMAKPAPGGRGASRWALVVRDLSGIVRKLGSGARFNVILFRTGVEAWKPRLVKATPGARRACRDWIGRARPAGWTNLYDALALGLTDDAVDALYVLTDGVPSRGTETGRQAILSEIAFLNRYRLVQINCVQAGASEGLAKAWRGFLDELARANDGVSVRE